MKRSMLLVIALICACTPLFMGVSADLEFIQLTEHAEWLPRQRANLVTLQYDVNVDDDLAIGKGSLVLLGGDNTAGSPVNDIWISPDGVNWQFVAGITDDGQKAPKYSTTAFEGRQASSSTVDSVTGRIYKICGSNHADVFYSDNVVEWKNAGTHTYMRGREYPGVAVDSNGRVIIAGGFYNGGALPDVWVSDDYGVEFTQVTGYDANSKYVGFGAAGWSGNYNGGFSNNNKVGGRGSLDFESWRSPITNRDALFLYTGSVERSTTYNDVWVSADSGATWLVVCKAAPWIARNDDTGGVTPNGILVVSGGRPAFSDGKEQPDLNDVWASLDGGYTWGQCSSAAEFPVRRYHSATFDTNGYYYILGGIDSTNTPLNDVWKSSFSFFDIDAVATHCNLTTPKCGVGLICFPGEATFGPDGAVTCPLLEACTGESSVCPSASSNSSAVAALAVLFVISTLIAAYAIYYIWKSKKSQQAGHISSGDSLGSLSDGNSLYKPLTIHS